LNFGEELLITYDTCSSAQMFARYGFLQNVPENAVGCESCVLEIPITDQSLPGGCHACKARLQMIRTVWRRSAWRPLLLRMPDAVSEGSLMTVARLAVLPNAQAIVSHGATILEGLVFLPQPLEGKAVALAQRWLHDACERVRAEQGRLSRVQLQPPGLLDIAQGLMSIELSVLERSKKLLAASNACA